MSASKGAWNGAGRSGRSDWRDVSGPHRCPICRGASWCQVNRSDPVVLCKRVPSDRPRQNRDGTEFWVHRLDGESRARWLPSAGPAAVRGVARASVADLDRAHRALLRAFPLSREHHQALERRGLSADQIERAGYGSLPLEGRARVARALAEELGEELVRGVPGFFVRAEGGRSWWSLAGWPGIVVPCRDLAGCIVALKIRRDDGVGGPDAPRYSYLSSARHGGPSAMHGVHVPVFEGDRRDVRVTEGELKADVAAALSGVLTLSVPGVGSWALALPVLKELGAERVRVAFDQDARTNAVVARAQRALLHALRKGGWRAGLECWPEGFKGCDDYFAALHAEAVG